MLAAEHGFAAKGVFHANKIAYDPEFSRVGPGKLLLGSQLQHYFENDSFLISPASGIQTDEMIRREDTLNQLEAKYYVEIITGKRPVSDFDVFAEEWTDLGGALIEYEINDWYQSTK